MISEVQHISYHYHHDHHDERHRDHCVSQTKLEPENISRLVDRLYMNWLADYMYVVVN